MGDADCRDREDLELKERSVMSESDKVPVGVGVVGLSVGLLLGITDGIDVGD